MIFVWGFIVFMVVMYVFMEMAVAAKEKSNDELRGRICDRLQELADRSYERRMRLRRLRGEE